MYPFAIPAATDQFSNRNDLTSFPKIETGNDCCSHHREEFYLIASDCRLSNSNDPKKSIALIGCNSWDFLYDTWNQEQLNWKLRV